MYVFPREAFIVQSRNITGHQSSDACQKLYPLELPVPDISHNNDIIMSTIASQITSITIVYSTVYSGADQRNHQRFASLAFVWGIHRGPVNSPHKAQVTRKCFYLMTSSCYRIFCIWNTGSAGIAVLRNVQGTFRYAKIALLTDKYYLTLGCYICIQEWLHICVYLWREYILQIVFKYSWFFLLGFVPLAILVYVSID